MGIPREALAPQPTRYFLTDISRLGLGQVIYPLTKFGGPSYGDVTLSPGTKSVDGVLTLAGDLIEFDVCEMEKLTFDPAPGQPFDAIRWFLSFGGPLAIFALPGSTLSVRVTATAQDPALAVTVNVTSEGLQLTGDDTTGRLDIAQQSSHCTPPDTDLDGIEDVFDNCPLVANTDQLDQDLDGIGNACDEDLDGDAVLNTSDNCPDLYNPNQVDQDGDGLGDECDDDTDGDSVPNDVDNCPALANTDQADTDGDFLGDACDADDDNDGVLDLVDNCPTVDNADQADLDGDGEGDACDGDVDGDLVANESDVCPNTPGGQPVSSDGCSGPQLLALSCPEGTFPNHGQYVSCVAHTARDLVDLGLITAKEKSRSVTQAARNR